MTHVAASLNRHSLSSKIVTAPSMFCRGLHRAKSSERGPPRRISTALPDQTAHVLRFERNVLHVRRARAHIFCGYVTAAQPLDKSPVRPEQLLPRSRTVAAEYD